MNFDEYKKKCETLFDRKLTDREVAECAINYASQLSDANDDYEEQIFNLKGDLNSIRQDLSESVALNPTTQVIARRIDELLSVPHRECVITVRMNEDEIPTISFTINGCPLEVER